MFGLRRFLVPAAIILAAVAAAHQYGSGGFLLVVGVVVFRLLRHFTRMMAILRRASGRPIG